MAKSKNTEEPQKAELQIQEKKLPVVITEDLITKATGSISKLYREDIDLFKAECTGLTITSIQDKDGRLAVNKAITRAVLLRNDMERDRKKITDPAVKFQKDVKAFVDSMVSEVTPIETALNQQKARIDRAELEAKQAEDTRRRKLLLDNGWTYDGTTYISGALQLHPGRIAELTEDQLQKFVDKGIEEKDRQAKEAQRKLEDEAKLKTERQELEALRKQLADKEAALNRMQEAIVKPDEPESSNVWDGLGSHPGTEAIKKAIPPDLRIPNFGAPVDLMAKAIDMTEKALNDGLAPNQDYESGWNDCKAEVLRIMTSDLKLTRADWINSIKSMQI